MKESGKIWMNGKLVPFADAKVHVLTHALHYSTSVFEGIRCYNTPEGPAIFRLDDHVDRMFRSAKMYSMKMRYTKNQIADAIVETVRACRLKECYIRPLAYYGYGEMGLTPTKNRVDVSISCWPWKMGESKAGKFSGARCMVSSWTRIDPRAQPVQAKAAANYSNAALARVEALENGYDEAIMLNGDGRVAEGSAENIFICTDGRILTPPLSTGCLSGITRDSVIKIAAADGIDISEYDLYRGRPVHGRRGIHDGHGRRGKVRHAGRPHEDRERQDGPRHKGAAKVVRGRRHGQGQEVQAVAHVHLTAPGLN